MPLFCSTCRNLMTIITTADTFHYQCNKCASFETPSDKDTLVYENVSGTNLTIYKSILFNAGKDPVNPKVRRTCKCGNLFAKQVRLGNEMRLINTCTSCSDQWLEGTRDTDVSDVSDSKKEISDSQAEGAHEDLKEESKSMLHLNPLTPNNKNAVVWFLFGGERYVPGIITSIYSVKRFNPLADLVVMVTNDVPKTARETIMHYATHLFEIPYLSFPGKFRMQQKMMGKYGSWIDKSFTKWNLLALPYEKAFLLDADVIAKKDISEIFNKTAPSAVFAKPMSSITTNKMPIDYSIEDSKLTPTIAKWILSHSDAFGAAASSILVAPNMDDYKEFLLAMENFKPLSLLNETGADEQSITYFYSMVKKITWTTLGPKWNTVPWFKKYADPNPILLHFMSKEKPWEIDINEWPDVAEWVDMYKLAKKSIKNKNKNLSK